jgi:DNA (cytosine-5)-methyltransferase 1
MEYILSTVCSGIGSPEFAADELSAETHFKPKQGFYCEINKFARASYEAMFGAALFVEDMTKAEWDGPEYYSDVFIGGIPCQAFSLAGLRKGELDPRGLLFYDFYRYVKKQQPKAFIIENVKGLLSDSNGKTFQNWLLMLGDSVNGHMQMFNHELSLGYNLHWTVLNTKDFGIPQNRERVFLVGIRPDLPNTFRFPVGLPLKLRLKDILEPIVDEKYYLSNTALKYLVSGTENGWSDRLSMLNHSDAVVSGAITANHSKGVPYNMLEEKGPEPLACRQVGRNPDNPKRRKGGLPTEQMLEVNDDPGITNVLSTVQKDNLIVEQNTILRWQNKTTGAVEDNIAPALRASGGTDIRKRPHVIEKFEPREDGITNTLSGVQKDNMVLSPSHRIRRLTPLECWRLQGFSDEAFYKAKEEAIISSALALTETKHADMKKAVKGMSDSQLYKQAGNSMTTKVIKGILKNILNCIFTTSP